MQDDEIRIACINAVVAWTGSSNKLQDAKTFYNWIIEGRVPAVTETKPITTKGKSK
jgi:hypothetical protein